MIIDLIYVRRPGEGSTVSIATIGHPDGDHLLGPVPVNGGYKALAPQLLARAPDQFPTLADVELFLVYTHMLYMHKGQNGAGQPYPFDLPVEDAK